MERYVGSSPQKSKSGEHHFCCSGDLFEALFNKGVQNVPNGEATEPVPPSIPLRDRDQWFVHSYIPGAASRSHYTVRSELSVNI